MSLIRHLIIILFLITNILLEAQTASKLIPVQIFSSKDFNAQPKNWAIAEDAFGRIYVGNKEGLLVYDGLWKKFRIDNANDIKSLCLSKDGNIYVGGTDEFGYFNSDNSYKGDLKYHPIYKLLDSVHIKKIGDIWYTFTQENKVYFISHNNIYIYENNKIETIDVKDKIIFAKKINNKILVLVKNKGLYKIENNKIISFGPSNYFIDTKGKHDIKSIANYSGNKFIYINSKNKLFTFEKKNNRIEKTEFKTQLSIVFDSLKIQNIIKLNNNYFAILSKGNGVFIINNKGDFIRKIDKSIGIGSGIIENIFFDSNNILWLAQDVISRVSIFSNYEYFPKDKLGIQGAVLGIERYNNKLFISSNYRLYTYNEPDYKSKKELSLEDIKDSKFSKAKIFNTDMSEKSTYGVLKTTIEGVSKLLFITDNYVFSINKKEEIDTVYHSSGNILVQDPLDEHRIWIGLYPKGLASFYYNDGNWIDEGKVKNTDADIRAICFDSDYNLWAGTTESLLKVYRPSFLNHKIIKPKVIHFSEKNGLPKNDAIFPFNSEGAMVFASSEGFLKYSDSSNHFTFTDEYTQWFKTHFVYRAKVDEHNNIWTVAQSKDKETAFIKKLIKNSEGNYIVKTPFARKISNELFEAMLIEKQSIWFGGSPSELIKLSIKNKDTINKTIVFINKVLSNKDTLFNGFFYSNKDSNTVDKQPTNMIKVLDYKQHNLTFFFGGISNKLESKPIYKWKLEGFENEWGDWTSKTEVRFTNLHEGDYTFKVQAKDIYGNISETVEYSFSIKPPWHRTIWAYIGYFLFFVAFVWGAINISTRSLKKIIREATAEIRAQKDDIEAKNKDIMSSIRYAQRIQEAVTPQKKLMNKVFPEHFVLWKPRDIVSGDFYWMMQKNGKAIIAAADCTGHGVPGAFMSIMGISFLNEIANNKEVKTAAEALNQLRHNVITSLNQEGSETDTKDGMDISLCVFDFDNMMMQFAGAYNPLYMIRDNELSVIKADRMPIGVHERDSRPFTNMEFSIHKGDIYYILSDGYIDQFGGERGKKFMTKRFKALLMDIYTYPMEKQKEILWDTILEWRGDIEQIDDIIIIGIKIV